jgi:hypothetical protein
MSVINRVPKGFLGLLDAKTQGNTPAEPIGLLSPVLDLTDNYLADLQLQTAVASGTFGSGDIGTNINEVEVPAGQLWYVYGVSGEVVAGATTLSNYGFGLVVDTNTGFGAHWLTEFQTAPILALLQFESWQVAWNNPKPLLLGSGSILAMRQTRLWSNASACTTSVLFRSVVV